MDAFIRSASVAMMARRSASLRLPHLAISPRVRPQPKQSPLTPSMTQTLVQGEETIEASEQPRSTDLEDADLVAVEIAEIRAVESAAAIAGRAFVLAAGSKRIGVDLFHDVL